MKGLKMTLFIILGLMISVVTFFGFNLLFSAVSNYASVSKVLLSLFPMFCFMLNLIVLTVAAYYFFIKKRKDLYFVRQYGLTVSIIALVGVLTSILTGTLVYGSFFKDYIFNAYPFIMLLVNLGFAGVAGYYAVDAIIKIKKTHPEVVFKGGFLYGLRVAGLSLLLTYAYERLGAFVLLPTLWSEVDSCYVIPYYIQLLIPTFIIVTYVIHEDFLANRKLTLILSSVAFGYSLFTLIYMILMSHNNHLMIINPLSPIQQLERLTTMPVDAIFMFAITLILPFLNGLNNTIMIHKEKKNKENKVTN